MRKFAALIVICVLVLCSFPAPAMADCSGGSCSAGQVVTAPFRAARAVAGRIRDRERKPIVTGVRWLFRR
jgi:hypothetical protein